MTLVGSDQVAVRYFYNKKALELFIIAGIPSYRYLFYFKKKRRSIYSSAIGSKLPIKGYRKEKLLYKRTLAI